MEKSLGIRSRGPRVLVCVAVVSATLLVGSALAVAAAAFYTQLVSIPTGGGVSNGVNENPDISADGRYVVWTSTATNLVSGGTTAYNKTDVFWRDRVSGITKRVSDSTTGENGDGDSSDAVVSGDGHYVAFISSAKNLVTGDTNGVDDVFVRDVVTGETERVSVSSSEVQADASCYAPVAISDDGRYVAFSTNSSGFGSVQSPQQNQVYVRDRQAGTTNLVSVDPSGDPGGDTSFADDITPDGRFVVFRSYASNITGEAGYWHICVRDRLAGTTTPMVNRTTAGDKMEASGASISDDGRYVAFHGGVRGTYSHYLVWVRDIQEATTELISKSSTGDSANSDAWKAEISGDGRYVAYESDATNLVASDPNGIRDIFRYDRTDETTERMSLKSTGDDSEFGSFDSSVSQDGQTVAFVGGGLVPEDEPSGGVQIYVRAFGEPPSPSKQATKLSFYAPSVSAYRSARVYGWLKDGSGTPLPGKPVEIQYYSGGWKKAATVTTDANGKYLKTMTPSARTSYRAVFAGDDNYESKTSAGRAVLPKVRLTRSTSWSRLRRSKTYYAKGYIAPKHTSSNGRVYIRAYKRASNGKYYYKKSFRASYSYYSSTKTRYRAAVKLTSRGTWKLVAYHGADSRNAKTYGSADYVKVR